MTVVRTGSLHPPGFHNLAAVITNHRMAKVGTFQKGSAVNFHNTSGLFILFLILKQFYANGGFVSFKFGARINY